MSHRTYLVRVDGRGRLVLPAQVRRELGVDRGDALVLEEAAGGVRLRSVREVAAAGRGLFASAGDTRELVDELLEERRREARSEADAAPLPR
jgi:AbrB family looped-hinge helix DNA binding protein